MSCLYSVPNGSVKKLKKKKMMFSLQALGLAWPIRAGKSLVSIDPLRDLVGLEPSLHMLRVGYIADLSPIQPPNSPNYVQPSLSLSLCHLLHLYQGFSYTVITVRHRFSCMVTKVVIFPQTFSNYSIFARMENLQNYWKQALKYKGQGTTLCDITYFNKSFAIS